MQNSSFLQRSWTHVTSKNSELDKKFQQNKGRVVPRGDVVKDDSGSYAVFTEQGSSASHMTAARVLDVISRLPGYAGQASDAVSAYTQVKMEDTPKLLDYQNQSAQLSGFVCHDPAARNPGTKFKIQCHLKEMCTDI